MKHLVMIRINLAVIMILISASTAFCGDSQTAISPKNDAGQSTESMRDETLLHNLQTAFTTESNEAEFYTAFGKRADEEGYGQVASLFRALAQAEKTHSANKSVLIEELNGSVEHHLDSLDVRTTLKNLAWAVEAENYEKDTMYPHFASHADKANHKEAQIAYELHLASEQRHVQILQQAQNDLDAYRGSNIDFYVCKRCGNVVRSLRFEACPICDSPKEDFVMVR